MDGVVPESIVLTDEFRGKGLVCQTFKLSKLVCDIAAQFVSVVSKLSRSYVTSDKQKALCCDPSF